MDEQRGDRVRGRVQLAMFALSSGQGDMQLQAQVSKTWGVVPVWLVRSRSPQRYTVANKL